MACEIVADVISSPILTSHPYLNLLDVVLDPLDGVAVDVIPRVHLFSSDYFGPDY